MSNARIFRYNVDRARPSADAAATLFEVLVEVGAADAIAADRDLDPPVTGRRFRNVVDRDVPVAVADGSAHGSPSGVSGAPAVNGQAAERLRMAVAALCDLPRCDEYHSASATRDVRM
jgi:hypothetical protein